jgi:hypothetical protein
MMLKMGQEIEIDARHMMTLQTYHFSLVLSDCDDVVNDMSQESLLKMSDDIFAAGCDDASPGVFGGEVIIDFDREDASLRNAVQSAIQQIEQAGYRVAEVRPEGYAVFQELNEQLARH